MIDAMAVRGRSVLVGLLLGFVLSVGLEWLLLTGGGHAPGVGLVGLQALVGLASGLGSGGIAWILEGSLARREGHYGD